MAAFQFLHPLGLREGVSEAREQMDAVFHAADEEGRAIELFGDAAEIRVGSRRVGMGLPRRSVRRALVEKTS